MRANVLQSTCKSSKQTQHRSACLCGCVAGSVDDDPADDDLEVELDVVSVALALVVVSSDFNAVVYDSILVTTAPVTRGRW